MKKIKFIPIFVNLALSILLSACGSVYYSPDSDLLFRYKDTPLPDNSISTSTPINPNAIVGVWKLITINGDIPEVFEEILTFLEDNTCSIVANTSSETCIYTFSNGKLKIVSLSGAIEYSVQFNNGQMTLNTGSITKTYTFIVYW